MTYLEEPERIEAARTYILHELKKARSLSDRRCAEAVAEVGSRTADALAALFHQATDPAVHPDELLAALSTEDLWRLFHALSYGWKDKELWNSVGWPTFRWVLKEVNPEDCVLDSAGAWLEQNRNGDNHVPMWVACDEALRLVEQGNAEALERMIQDYESESRDQRGTDPLIGRQRPDDAALLIHDGNGRLQVWAARVALGRATPERIPVWIGYEGQRPVSTEDEQVLGEAMRSLFPIKPEVKLIERRMGTDGMEYFAQRVGPYGRTYFWFVWRIPVTETAGAGETIGQVVNRAGSLEEAERQARATLDRVVPVAPQKRGE